MGAENHVCLPLNCCIFFPIITHILTIGQIVVKYPYVNFWNDWFSVVVLTLFHAWMLTYLCVLCIHKYWWSCLFRACVLSQQLAVCMRTDRTIFFCMHTDWATCLTHTSWQSDLFCACLLKERLVLCMLIEGVSSFVRAYWRSELFCACLLKERLAFCMFIEGVSCFVRAYWRSDLFCACLLKERLVLCVLIEVATLTDPANCSEPLIVTFLYHILHSSTFGVPSVTA